MAELNEGRRESAATGWFTVDAAYLKQQAAEAFRTFIAPLAGVYGAATSRDQAAIHPDRSDSKTQG